MAESLSDNIMLLDPDGSIRCTNDTVPDLTIAQVVAEDEPGVCLRERAPALVPRARRLDKPYAADALLRCVRRALDEGQSAHSA